MDTERRNANTQSLSAVRRDLVDVNEKINSIYEKVNIINEGLSPVPNRMMNVEDNLTFKAQKMAELEERNKLHSAKLKLLQKEVQYEKMRGEMMMDYLKESPRGIGNSNTGYNTTFGDGFGGATGNQDNGMATGRTDYTIGAPEHDQYPRQSNLESPSPQVFTGGATQMSRQQTPYNPREPKNDTNGQRNPEDNARNKDFNATGGQAKNNNAFDFGEVQKQRRKEIYSIYDSTAINPQFYEPSSGQKKYPWFDHEVTYTTC